MVAVRKSISICNVRYMVYLRISGIDCVSLGILMSFHKRRVGICLAIEEKRQDGEDYGGRGALVTSCHGG